MKSKKVIAGILAVTMMFGGMAVNSNVLEDIGFGITASAVDKGTVNCSTNAEISTALINLSEGDSIVINVTRDTTDDYYPIAYGSNMTINLNGHTLNGFSISLPQTYKQILTINGDGGKIKASDSIYENGNAAVSLRNNNELIANNVSIIGGNGIGAGVDEGYGIECISNSTVELNNCYVSAGSSTDDSLRAQSAVFGLTDATVKVKNTTFTRQNGVINRFNPLIYGVALKDFDGNKITNPDYTISTFKVGLSSITQKDKSPAQAQISVSATSKIPAPTYTVTIPATIDFENVSGTIEKYRNKKTDSSGKSVVATKEFTVSATSVDNLFDGKTLSVSIGATGQKTILFNETTNIECTLKKGTAVYTEGTEFANFVNDYDLAAGKENKQVGSLSFNRADIKTDGIYTGLLTFNVSVKEG